MRPIDADALHKIISEWPESVMYKDWVQSAIANAPTIAPPPNDPLTLPELREMEEEPVYVGYQGGNGEWGFVYKTRRYGEIYICFLHMLRAVEGKHGLFEQGANIYRRKPEEGT